MAYVYEHWRPDKDVCFYVGKGSGKRARLLRRRNKHYNSITAKLASIGMAVDVRIVVDGLSDTESFVFEEERIAFWKAKGVRLANQSTGGRGGTSGIKRSDESRKKQSVTNTGRKMSDEFRDKHAARMRSPEKRARISAIHKGRKRPIETGIKIGIAQKKSWEKNRERRLEALMKVNSGRTVSDETKTKMRAAKTPEVRARISAAAKEQWQDPAFRKLVSDTMKRTNAARQRKDTICSD